MTLKDPGDGAAPGLLVDMVDVVRVGVVVVEDGRGIASEIVRSLHQSLIKQVSPSSMLTLELDGSGISMMLMRLSMSSTRPGKQEMSSGAESASLVSTLVFSMVCCGGSLICWSATQSGDGCKVWSSQCSFVDAKAPNERFVEDRFRPRCLGLTRAREPTSVRRQYNAEGGKRKEKEKKAAV